MAAGPGKDTYNFTPAALASDVRFWVNNAASNFGVALVGNQIRFSFNA
jgi:hypothetical protein